MTDAAVTPCVRSHLTVTVRSPFRRRTFDACHTGSTSATCLSGTARPVCPEYTSSDSILSTSCRSAATERSVIGMTFSSSRYCVLEKPLSTVCSENATSSLVTPARRARAWLTRTTSFFVRRPQSSRIPLVPLMLASFAFTASARMKMASRSVPEMRTSIG